MRLKIAGDITHLFILFSNSFSAAPSNGRMMVVHLTVQSQKFLGGLRKTMKTLRHRIHLQDRVLNPEPGIYKDVQARGRYLHKYTISVFSWRHWGAPWKVL